MNIVVVYIYPYNGRVGHSDYVVRFIKHYQQFPAEEDHRLIVVSNGEAPSEDTKKLFAPLPNASFFEHDNSGFDIGAFQHVARDVECELMVFFGATAYVRVPGWLKRMVELYQQYGNNLYGSMQVPDAVHIGIWPHIRTTGFWLKRETFLSYPHVIARPEQRYPFEHGPESLTMFCARTCGCGVGTLDNWYWMDKWREVVEGYHWGEQKQLLTGDRMSCPPYYPVT